MKNITVNLHSGRENKGEESSTSPLHLHDIAYGTNPRQTMDIYLPANRSEKNTPTLVLIHGGGWASGSKTEFASYLDDLKRRLPAFAFIAPNYRLASGGYTFPTQEEDLKAALRFIVQNAGYYGVDSGKISLLGFSAGAHLALLQAYKNAAPRIASVVDFFGPSDLLAMYRDPVHPLVPMALEMVTGTTPVANETLYKQSSPIHFVSPGSPPTLMLHGANDKVVSVTQSVALAAKLKGANVPHELYVYPYEGHGRWYGKSAASSFDHLTLFLKKYGQ